MSVLLEIRRVYVAVYLDGTRPWGERRDEGSQRVRTVELYLESLGLEILRFTSKGLPFDPFRGSIEDFVAYADCVIGIHTPPLLGISPTVMEYARVHHRPCFEIRGPDLIADLKGYLGRCRISLEPLTS